MLTHVYVKTKRSLYDTRYHLEVTRGAHVHEVRLTKHEVGLQNVSGHHITLSFTILIV